jgi:hypothetical protein
LFVLLQESFCVQISLQTSLKVSAAISTGYLKLLAIIQSGPSYYRDRGS